MYTEKPSSLTDDVLSAYTDKIRANGAIDPALYEKYNVKRGLRNTDGTGVLVGLTRVGSVHGYIIDENEKVCVRGKQYYRGIDVEDFVPGVQKEGRPGFEECAYLLLFGSLPSAVELKEWNQLLDDHRRLPYTLKESIIRFPGQDIMNSISRAVLTKYTLDESPDALDIPSVLRQSIELIAQFSAIAAYAYQAKLHYFRGRSLLIRHPESGKGTADNFLMMIREDGQYTALEAELLDLALILHAEHGGGNNSAFTTHVVTSAATDTYSAIAAANLSLKGFRHGGANLKVMTQMAEMKAAVKNCSDESEIGDYLRKVIRKEAGDGSGLIYGLGHAVYTLSDPRAELLREKARQLASAKGREEEFAMYEIVDRIGPQIFNENRAKHKPLCSNVDFYSGFVYDMLNIPLDLYTPLFAVSRVVGWAAHRIEELVNGGPIVRPAYKAVGNITKYVPLGERS